jgi:hypothetical protein
MTSRPAMVAGLIALVILIGAGCSQNSSAPGTPPPAPELLSPADGAVLSVSQPVTLTWSALSGAGQYSVEIAAASDFTTLEESYTVKATTTQVSDLEAGAHYWRVRGAGAPGEEFAWSDVRSFVLVSG